MNKWKSNYKNKYNMEFKKSGVSFELKGIKNKKENFYKYEEFA